jgi:endoglucanase
MLDMVRRWSTRARAALLAGILAAAAALAPEPAGAQQPAIGVAEVAMAAPDIVVLDLRDPPFERGRLVALDEPRGEPPGTWVLHGGREAMVVGPKRDHLRLADAPPVRYLDRTAIDDPAGYAPIGGRRVVDVFRKSMPVASGLFAAPNGDSRSGAGFRHLVYLQLDGPLAEGDHAIDGPADLPADLRLRFDDEATRASAIHATQLGHRPGDGGKVAFLSLWLPGGPRQGAVDFRDYGLDVFRVLDAAGRPVFKGPIRLRAAPTDPEPGNGLPAELVDTADAAARPIPIDALAGDRVLTAEPHGFSEGQRVVLQRLGGEQDASALFATVVAPDAFGFRLAEASGAVPAQAAAGATVAPAHRANRAGTFVFELDYSAWRPSGPGTVRLQVPGLGVSDPIEIAEDVWLRSAGLSLGGLYNHRSGIALDGRFGYERPTAFRPGVDARVLRSRLPLSFVSDRPGGFVSFEDGAAAPWIVGGEGASAEAWGGYMDAGDWDRRILHLNVAALLLEAQEALARAKLDPSFGVPPSSAVLSPAPYAGTDDLPDLVHEAIWVLDFFRRLQAPEGGVPGGIESASHPLKGEPSFLEHNAIFVFAPDMSSSYRYAGVAAALVRTLRAENQPKLAALFEESALRAWRAAEADWADPEAAYAEAIAAAREAGSFDEALWPERRDAMQAEAADQRAAAAAALFRLTGERAYAGVFESAWRGGWDLYAQRGDAAWDYLVADGREPNIAAEIERMIDGEAQSILAAQDGLSYPALKHPFAPAGWGQGGAPDYNTTMLMMRAHRLSGDSAILRAMERAHHAMLGANQVGLSLMTGAGVRPVAGVLHEDSLAMGVSPPAGITVYGWAPQAASAYGWVFGPPWSALPEVGTAENAEARRIEPSRFAMPYFEYLVEHPAMIIQMEYTVHQTVGPMAALALYIAAH